MGKASRAKRLQKQNVGVDTAKKGPADKFGGGDDIVVIDGVIYRGKKKIREVYESWVRNAINFEQLEHLPAIAELGKTMHSEILLVDIELIDPTDGSKLIVKPLVATFLLEKEQLFHWFLEHACKSLEGNTIATLFALECVRGEKQCDRTSARGRMMAKLFEKTIEFMHEQGWNEQLATLEILASAGGIIADELRGFKARTEAGRERKSLLEEFGMRPDPDKSEWNPEEVSMPQGEVLTAHMSPTGNLSQGRRSMSL